MKKIFMLIACYWFSSCRNTSRSPNLITGGEIGNITNNQKQGLWKAYYPLGRLKSVGWYRNDEKDSTWTKYYSNGHVAAVENFKLGKRHGKQTYFDEDGNVSGVLEYKNDKLFSVVHYYRNGHINAKSSYINDSTQGPDSVWWENGQLKQAGQNVNGKPTGVWQEYDSLGRLIYSGPLR